MGVGISTALLQTLQINFKFKWTDTALKYLGMYIPSDLTQVFELNFPPLLTRTRISLETWNQGLHSWFGRCNLLKMSILPKYVYLLQTLPIKIPSQYFKQVHSLFIKFIWANKRPCIPRSQLSKHSGGIALPDVLKYYQAVHLGQLIDWSCHSRDKLWVQIEQAQTDVLLKGAPWCYDNLPSCLKLHPLIGPTVRTFSQVIIKTSLSSMDLPLMPILGNPRFPPGWRDHHFSFLQQTNCFRASNFLLPDGWPSIAALMEPLGSLLLPFWNALQLHHFLCSLKSLERFG